MAAPTNGNGKQPDDPLPETTTRRTDDVEDHRPPPTGAGNAAIPSFVQRLIRRENLQEKGGLFLQALGLIFSLLSAIIMASNKHGDWMNFDRYEEYRYLLAISILVFLYSLGQVIRQVHLSSTGNDMLPARISTIFSFVGDQVAAYLMISALSAAIPITNNMRKGADNLFTDASSASIINMDDSDSNSSDSALDIWFEGEDLFNDDIDECANNSIPTKKIDVNMSHSDNAYSSDSLPPIRRRAPGRPKKKRRMEADEEKSKSKMSRKFDTIKCSKCGLNGHNKKTCKN